MKFRTRLCSLLLAGVIILSLTACSGLDRGDTLPLPSDAASSSPSDSAGLTSDSLLPEDFTADTAVEDLCLATTGIPGDFTLLTVNGVPVTAYYYLSLLTSNISYLELYYGLTMDTDPSLAEYLKEATLDAAVQDNLAAAKAQELGYDLTQEQLDELDSRLALIVMSNGGEEVFADTLRKVGLDYDTFYNVYASSYYRTQLQNGLFADRPTAEEMNAYIEENDILYAKHILLMTVDPTTYEPLDEATIAEKKATAESLLAQLQASSDLLTDFDTLMNEYSEDTGLVSYPDGYVFTAGQMVPEFESATRELEYGQISGLVESTYGYHIILRLDPDTEATRTDCRASLLYDQLAAWADEADIVLSDEYQALDVPLFYEKYQAYQDAFAAEAAAAAEAVEETDTAAEAPED